MTDTFPPAEPGRHGIAELLTLVDELRRLAHDTTLAPDDAMRRVRDLIRRLRRSRKGSTWPVRLTRGSPLCEHSWRIARHG